MNLQALQDGLNTKVERLQSGAFLPPGAFSAALGVVFLRTGHEATLGFRTTEKKDRFLATRTIDTLKESQLPKGLKSTDDITTLTGNSDLVVIGAPSHVLADFAQGVIPHVRKDALILLITKGLDPETGRLPYEVIVDIDADAAKRTAVLSGFGFAKDIIKNERVLTVIASKDIEVAKKIAQEFNDLSFKSGFDAEASNDVVGVGWGGAAKGPIAVSVGLGIGLGYFSSWGIREGIDAGFEEIVAVGTALGGKRETFRGRSGWKDLYGTCMSPKSRNRQFGIDIAGDTNPKQKLAKYTARGITVEGARAARPITDRAHRLGISVPITESIALLVEERITSQQAYENFFS